MTLTDRQIGDLLTGTLNRLGRMRFNQIATRLQDYEFMRRLFKKDKVQFDDGIGIQRTLMTDHSNAAKNVSLYEPDNVNVGDVLQTISIPWRHTTTNWAYERREMLMNRGESRIVDLMKVRRTDAMISLTERIETDGWSLPAATDEKSVYGIPYWVVYNATDGFTGGAPSGYTTVAGLSPTTHTRWKNYSATYTSVTKDDAIKQMRTAYRKIGFKSPVDIRDFRVGSGDRYRIYCGETVINEFEQVGEAQNENLGRDIARMDGQMVFRGNPIVWVPKLDANTTSDEIYMLNLSYFNPVFLRGDYLRESQPRLAPSQHNTWVCHVDLTWNLLCTDRRKQAIISKSAIG